VLKSRPLIGLVILILSAVVWWLGRLPGPALTGGTHDRRLLLITVTIVGISVAAAVLSFLGHGSPLR
jgi:hypothetical protein